MRTGTAMIQQRQEIDPIRRKKQMTMNPQMCMEFLGLVSLNASLVFLISELQGDLKVLAGVYAAVTSTVTGTENPLWLRISRLLTTIDKPFAFLMDQVSVIAPRIAALVLETAPDVDQKLLLPASSYRKEGLLSLVTELSGVRAPELDDKVQNIPARF